MTSLPTTASHGATPTEPSWKKQLKKLSAVFQSRHTTNTNVNTNSNILQNFLSDASDASFRQEANENVSSGGERGGSKWYRIQLGKGMINDVKRRAPFYLSDWVDAWDYRVVPATIYMYFANILPALAFSLDM